MAEDGGINESSSSTMASILQEVDSIIAQHMHELSQEDREKSYHDLHGISSQIEESKQLIEESLFMMNTELLGISNEDKAAYNLAESLDSNYVHCPNFRLKFLRGTNFDAAAASQRLVKHFTLKQELFGNSKLVKDIRQDDLGPDDINALYNGFVQWLPIKDPAGRVICIIFPGKGTKNLPLISRVSDFILEI